MSSLILYYFRVNSTDLWTKVLPNTAGAAGALTLTIEGGVNCDLLQYGTSSRFGKDEMSCQNLRFWKWILYIAAQCAWRRHIRCLSRSNAPSNWTKEEGNYVILYNVDGFVTGLWRRISGQLDIRVGTMVMTKMIIRNGGKLRNRTLVWACTKISIQVTGTTETTSANWQNHQ